MARLTKIFAHIGNGNVYDGVDGSQLTTSTFPYTSAKELSNLQIQYVTEFTDIDTFVPYTEFAGETVTSSAVIDNDWNHVDKGDLAVALTAGVITEIEIDKDSLANIPQTTGIIRLINAGSQTETVAYTAVTTSGDNYLFTVNVTLAYSYAIGDSAATNDPPLIKTTTVDVSGKDTGLFVVTLDSNTQPYLLEVEGEPSITGCIFEQQFRDDLSRKIFEFKFSFLCYNSLDDDGALPPPSGIEFYTKIECDARFIPINEATVSEGTVLISTDKFIAYDATTGEVKKRPVSEIALGSGTPPVQNEYADVSAMLADQGNQSTNYFQQVGTGKDATIYKKTSSSTGDLGDDYIDVTGKPVHKAYTDTIAMIADQANQKEDFLYSAGTTTVSYYEYLGTTVGDITDYQQVAGGGGSSAPPVADSYADTSTMISDQGSQLAGYFYEVNEVYYQYLGTTNGNLTDYKYNTDQTLKTTDSVEFSDITLGSANVSYDADFDLIEYSTGAGDTVKVGLDDVFVFYNDTGAEIPAGRVLHLVAVSTASGHILPTFEQADASDWQKCQGTLIFTCCAIPIASVGIGLTKGQADGVDTTGFAAPAQVWLSADGSGLPTTVKPTFPDFSISVGGVANAQADGTFVINFTTSITDIFNDAWDGAFVESFDFLVTSDGATITGSLVNVNPTRTMTGIYSSGFHTFDTVTAPLTIELTAGTDSTPQKNYIYIPETTKVLTVSSTGWPTGTEHIKISDSFVKTAVTTQNDGVLVNRNWNDHIKQEGNNGHILHLAENLRGKDAEWISGVEGSVTVTGGAAIDTAVTGGKISQLHEQTFTAFDTSVGDKLEVVNDFTSPYLATADLEDVTTDSSGDSLTNTSYKVVIWGVQNKTGQNDKVMVNMPSGTYAKNTPDDAVNDASNYANYSFPEIFKGKGFLIKEATFVNNGGTISLYNEKDLRGKTPNTVSGGGGGGGTGATTYLGLTDTDNSYTGHAGKVPKVNDTETALEFESVDISEITTTGDADDTVYLADGAGGIKEAGYNTTLAGTANITAYTPTADYHPATKLYVDNITVDIDNITTGDYDNNTVFLADGAGNLRDELYAPNATHTGEVTGSGVLTVNPTAISNKSTATLAGTEEVLVNDAGTLKKTTAQDIADLGGGGGGGGGYTPPATTNAVVDTDTLTATTVTNTFAGSTDGTVKIADAPTHGTQYWLYVSGTASVKVTNVTGTTILPTVTIVDKEICLEYSTVSASYKVVR